MERAAVAVVALEAADMTDWREAWHRYQVAQGERCAAMRQAGATWREIADKLRLGTPTEARRAVGLFLYTTHAEGRSDAQAAPATAGPPAG